MKSKLLTTGLATCVFLALFTTGCQKKTGQLSAELQARFEKEGIAHRADDLVFRRTHVAGEQDGSWDEKRASIVVTSTSVFLHENGKPLVEITPRSTGFYEVHREKDRISLRAGSGKSALSWSFRPPGDADKWTIAIRSVIKNAKSRPAGD
jgi:hypothetical protein